MELKRIGILSLAKIFGLFGVIYGLFSAILLVIVYAQTGNLQGVTEQLSTLMNALGYWSLLIFPILNGVIYFIAGVVLAFIYNLLAGWLGGIRLEFKK